jgi:hypothetical protein
MNSNDGHMQLKLLLQQALQRVLHLPRLKSTYSEACFEVGMMPMPFAGMGKMENPGMRRPASGNGIGNSARNP